MGFLFCMIRLESVMSIMQAYKTECPQCHGGNFYITPENGKRYCFNCAYFESDGVFTAPHRAQDINGIRQFYTEIADYYHSCLTPDHISYLNRRGISDNSIEKFKLGFVPQSTHILYNDSVAVESGMVTEKRAPFLANRIVFPYYVNSTVTDFRGRFVGEHEVKYLSPKGSSYYRGADYAFNHAALESQKVVITEGDPKAIVSEQLHVPTISIPGILSIRPQVKQRAGQTFIACFDSQIEHMYDVIRAIQRLASMVESLLVATLPLCGFDKMDIDTFILLKGAEAYKRVIDRALPYNTWVKLIRP